VELDVILVTSSLLLLPPVRPVAADDRRRRERDRKYAGGFGRPSRGTSGSSSLPCNQIMYVLFQRVFRIYDLGSWPRRAHMSLSSYYMNGEIRFQSLDTSFMLQP